MGDFRKSGGNLNITEAAPFSDPHIRFVRIRGRVVPIVNKRRVGQTVNKTGNILITAGAVLGVVGGRKQIFRAVKKIGVKKILSNPRTSKIFNATRANSTMFKQTRTAGLALSKFSKRSLITAAALGVAGVGAKLAGFEVATDSPLGADFL